VLGSGGEYLEISTFSFRPKNRSGTGTRRHGIPWLGSVALYCSLIGQGYVAFYLWKTMGAQYEKPCFRMEPIFGNYYENIFPFITPSVYPVSKHLVILNTFLASPLYTHFYTRDRWFSKKDVAAFKKKYFFVLSKRKSPSCLLTLKKNISIFM
jgi:hypothetical protein